MRTQALPLQACKSGDCFSERYPPQPGSSLLTTVATTLVVAITLSLLTIKIAAFTGSVGDA